MAKASTKRLFTPQLIERLNPEKGRRVEIMDSNCPGLVLRVTEGGVRTFGVLYRVAGKGGVGGRGKPLMGPQQRFTLGKYPRIGLKQARERARAIIDEASERRLPAGVRRPGDVVSFTALPRRPRHRRPVDVDLPRLLLQIPSLKLRLRCPRQPEQSPPLDPGEA